MIYWILVYLSTVFIDFAFPLPGLRVASSSL